MIKRALQYSLYKVSMMGFGAFLLAGCSVLQAPSHNLQSNRVLSSQNPAIRATALGQDSNAVHYKFESVNPIYKNLGQDDAHVNKAHLRTRNAMSVKGPGEEARLRFSPKGRATKIKTPVSYEEFYRTYSPDFEMFDSNKRFNSESNTQDTDPQDIGTNAEIAFVKTMGVSDPADWNQCARDAQGVFDDRNMGVKLKPSFSNCMRAKGYKPEAEALKDYTLSDSDLTRLDKKAANRDAQSSTLQEDLVLAGGL